MVSQVRRLFGVQPAPKHDIIYVPWHCDREGTILAKALNCGLLRDRRNGFNTLGIKKGAGYDIRKVNPKYLIRKSLVIGPRSCQQEGFGDGMGDLRIDGPNCGLHCTGSQIYQ